MPEFYGLTEDAGVENVDQVQGRIQDLKLGGVKQRSLEDFFPQMDREAKPR